MMDMGSMLRMQGMMFLIMLVGVVFQKNGTITREVKSGLTDLVLNLILPCNILCAFQQSDASLLGKMANVVVMGILFQLIWLVACRWLWKNREPARRGVLHYAFQFSNSGFLGNPIVEGIYGPTGLAYASVYLISFRIFMWTAGIRCFTAQGGKGAIKKLVTHPCIIATVLGVLWMLVPVELPGFVMDTLSGFSKCLTPLAMLIIGAILAEANIREMFCKDVYVVTFCRLLLQPLIAFAICYLLRVDALVSQVVVVLVGMPVGSTTAILAAKYKGDESFAGDLVVFSTVLSLVTVPILSILMGMVY